MITNDVEAKLNAYILTRKFFADNPEKLTAVLQEAKVDLNPHQVEAALFAFKSPFSKGAILADEVGLGKTIEAGLVLSQHYAENKKKILIIVPSSLRKQWNLEMMEKFYLKSKILESRSFNEEIRQGNFNPFCQDGIVVASYNFAKNKIEYLKAVNWDLVVIDEAHRLRNAHKTDNKTARALKENLSKFKKILLTATPLQNSLLELFSLVSFIDDNIFGDIVSYKMNYIQGEMTEKDFADLKQRIKPIIFRTLRKQVLEYVKYTNRIPLTQEFIPNEDEQKLYDMLNDYLSRYSLLALPNSQRQLITLIMRKLLASSTFAISGTLKALIERLNSTLKNCKAIPDYTFTLNDSGIIEEDFADIYLDDEETDDIDYRNPSDMIFTYDQFDAIQAEIRELENFLKLSESITKNAKGESLSMALEKGFTKLKELGANEKAVIFTESRRTQEYVRELLEKGGYDVVLFNGSNNDEKSKKIYEDWLKKNKSTGLVAGSRSADTRQALVDYFKDTAQIMIATEAAAEGINLQFCSLVVNYDLPWNPQRIEQRIGRCHRYGQKFDVVVINFLNMKNQADQRVYELLNDKFKLFEGVFGSSDEVLGSIESGVDFEKRINEIYQTCRTKEQIDNAFNALKESLSEEISGRIELTKQKLLDNFDEEVHEKLKINFKKNKEYIDKYSARLNNLAKYILKNDIAEDEKIDSAEAKKIFAAAKNLSTINLELIFDLSAHKAKLALLETLKGKSGTLTVNNLNIGIDEENYLIYSGVSDDGDLLLPEQAERLFNLKSSVAPAYVQKVPALLKHAEEQSNKVLGEIERRNSLFFDDEIDKLERWCGDLKNSLEIKLKQMDIDIKTMKTESKKILVLADKLDMQRHIKELESKRNKLRLNLYEEQDKIEDEKDRLIEDFYLKLKKTVSFDEVFSIRWRVV